MKICLVSTPAIKIEPSIEMEYAGTELQVSLLAEELSKKHDITVIAPEESYLDGVRVYETIEANYGGKPAEATHIGECERFLLESNFDAICDHTHFFPAYRLKKNNPDLPVHWSCHDWQPASRAPPVDVPIYARSKAHAEHLSDLWDVKVDFIYNGIDMNQFEYREDKDDYALFFGRMSAIKGPYEFTKICEKVGMKGVIAGEDSIERGVEPETPRKVIKECNETDLLTYLGRVSPQKKGELFSKAKVYVSPLPGGHVPPFDLTNIEAAASGTPAISVSKGAIPEVIDHEVSGFVADSCDEIPKYFDRVDEIDPKDCRKQAEKFSKQALASRYEKAYRRLKNVAR